MKTKHILTAMVLPTLLAACTADEIVENNNNIVALGRANVEAVSFAANGTDSRLAYNADELKWEWEDTDKFLLLNADDGKAPKEDAALGGRFTPGIPTTGYEYMRQEDGTYETEASVMGEGLYWGYAPSEKKTTRGFVEYALPASQKLNDYQGKTSQVLITPLYEVSAAAYNNKLPLDMINWYSTVILPLTNSTRYDITIKQIVLKAVGTEFNVKGKINTSEMGDFIVAWDADKNNWVPAVNCDDKEDNDVKDMVKLLDNMRKANLTETVENGTSQALVLDAEETVIPAGETVTFHMLAPYAESISCDIAVIAEEGIVEIDHTSKSNYLKNTNIYHNGKKAAFGWTSTGEAKAYDIKKFENLEGAYYVTSYNDMMGYINTVNGTFSVYNLGDWALDADMAVAIDESDAYVIFKNDVKIEGEVKLTKVAFGAGAKVTVAEGAKVEFASAKYEIDENDEEQDACVYNLVVEEGAEATLTSGHFHAVKNNGTLNVTAAAGFDAESEIETAGTLNLIENNNAASIILNGGTLNYNQDSENDGWTDVSNKNLSFSLKANAEIVVAKGVELKNNVAKDTTGDEWVVKNDNGTTKYAVSVTNNGTISLSSQMHIYGTLTNNGSIEGGAYGLFLNKTAVNAENAVINVKRVVNNGTLTNNGEVLAENNNSTYKNENNGVIVTGVGSKTYVKAGEGRINNSAKAKVSVDDGVKQEVYFEYDNVTATELAATDFSTYSVNTLVINKNLTMDTAFDADGLTVVDASGLSGLKVLELANGAKVNVNANVEAKTYFEKIILKGNATISGWNKENSSLTLENPNTTLEVHKAVAASDTADGYILKLSDIVVKGSVSISTVEHNTVGTNHSINTKVKLSHAKWGSVENGTVLTDSASLDVTTPNAQ